MIPTYNDFPPSSILRAGKASEADAGIRGGGESLQASADGGSRGDDIVQQEDMAAGDAFGTAQFENAADIGKAFRGRLAGLGNIITGADQHIIQQFDTQHFGNTPRNLPCLVEPLSRSRFGCRGTGKMASAALFPFILLPNIRPR